MIPCPPRRSYYRHSVAINATASNGWRAEAGCGIDFNPALTEPDFQESHKRPLNRQYMNRLFE
jgi:hypothetical protein